MISSDARFKAIEDSRTKEDYFRDFVDELAKKEAADKARRREEASSTFETLLRTLKGRHLSTMLNCMTCM